MDRIYEGIMEYMLLFIILLNVNYFYSIKFTIINIFLIQH